MSSFPKQKRWTVLSERSSATFWRGDLRILIISNIASDDNNCRGHGSLIELFRSTAVTHVFHPDAHLERAARGILKCQDISSLYPVKSSRFHKPPESQVI